MKFSWPVQRPAAGVSTSRLASLRRRSLGSTPTRRVSLPRLTMALVTGLILTLLLCIHLIPNRVSLRLGDFADKEVIAQRTVRYEDTDATNRMRRDAVALVERRYELIPDARRDAVDSATTVFDVIRLSSGVYDVQDLARVTGEIERQSGLRLSGPLVVKPLAAASAKTRASLRDLAAAVVGRAMDAPLRDDPEELMAAREIVERDSALMVVPASVRPAVARLCSEAVSPNRRFDARATERAQAEAAASVPRQFRRIAAGQAIVKAGERVTQGHMDAFSALGLRSASLDAGAVATIAGLVTLMVALTGGYLHLFEKRLASDNAQLLLLCIVTVISVLGIKAGSTLLGLSLSGVQMGYLGMMCVASSAMVISLLLSPSAATWVAALLSVTNGVVLNNELRFALTTLGSALVGIVAVATLRNRTDLMRAALVLCGANALLNVVVGGLEGDTSKELLAGALWGLVSGGVALMLFFLGVALFERLFHLTTHLRLLELSDPATPVLQEFRMRVPGTYAHSLMVGNLAHAAAEAIGADALLVRVAAYYHDLGKMNRPEFFIENQTGENVHENLNPSLSAIVLTSHVKEGLEMAASAGIPPRVREVISQHHGTSLMRYFYHQATGGVPNKQLEAQFRYPGPKPTSKEAAILMLADTVEAASRTLTKPTPQRLAEFVSRMIEDKRADGQLDECALTLRDLRTLEEVFTTILSGTLHGRITYPNSPANNVESASGVSESVAQEEQPASVARDGVDNEDPRSRQNGPRDAA
jgi:putative nucleotidyltransferase with HDIG domain